MHAVSRDTCLPVVQELVDFFDVVSMMQDSGVEFEGFNGNTWRSPSASTSSYAGKTRSSRASSSTRNSRASSSTGSSSSNSSKASRPKRGSNSANAVDDVFAQFFSSSTADSNGNGATHRTAKTGNKSRTKKAQASSVEEFWFGDDFGSGDAFDISDDFEDIIDFDEAMWGSMLNEKQSNGGRSSSRRSRGGSQSRSAGTASGQEDLFWDVDFL